MVLQALAITLISIALSTSQLFAGDQRAALLPKALEVYPNGAFLVEEATLPQFHTGSVTFSLPDKVGLDQVEAKVSPASCRIDSLTKLVGGPLQGQELLNRLKELKRRKKKAENKKVAIMQQIELLKGIMVLDPKTGRSELASVMDLIAEKMAPILDSADTLDQQIGSLNQEIEELEARLRSTRESRFRLKASCSSPGNLELIVRHPVRLSRQEFGYKISGDTKAGVVTVSGELFLKQSTGRDWKGLMVRFFTAPKNRAVSPAPFEPQFLSAEREERSQDGGMLFMKAAMPAAPLKETAKKIRAFSRDYYQAQGVHIPAGEEIPVELFSYRMKAGFKVEIDGYDTATPFLSATVTPPEYLPGGNARLYLDGAVIGKWHLPPSPKGQEKTIYFGEDIFLQVSKKLQRDFTKRPFIGKKVIETREWKYVIKNLHPMPFEVSLVERTPVSRDEEIEVKAWGTPMWHRQEKDGNTIWNFTLAPRA